MLQKSNTEKITQNEKLRQNEVINAQKYLWNKKEILEYHE